MGLGLEPFSSWAEFFKRMGSWNFKTLRRMRCVLVGEDTQWPLSVCGLSIVVHASVQSQRLFSLLPVALELRLPPVLQPEPYQRIEHCVKKFARVAV